MVDTTVQQSAQDEHAVTTSTADIVVGLLSYKSPATIGNLARAARDTLIAFPSRRGVIVNADGGSNDGTQDNAEAAAGADDFVKITYSISAAQKDLPEYYSVPGKLNALQAVFGVASELNVAACAIIDSNRSSPGRDWIDALVRPVIENGADFVLPGYLRHKYDGLILNGIVYPLTRALYGAQIHQPIGGDYAVSGRLVKYLLTRPRPSDGEATDFGADAWAVTQALCGGFLFAEALLGLRVFTREHDPAIEVSDLLSQSLGAVFVEMNRTASAWQRIRGSQPVQTVGLRYEPLPDPAPVDPSPMVQAFRMGYQNLRDVYQIVLPPATLVELKRMAFHPPDTFRFDNVLWARIIYDFALAWKTRIIDRDHLFGALTPLYLGWVASWVLAVRDLDPRGVQDLIESLCLAYETQKGYLISRWRWPDRFNP
jgi:glucosylglycerate synthase